MAIDRGKLIARFLQEAREHCAGMERGLVSLEGNPGDRETLDGVYRSAHTIKGASRMMKFPDLSAVAHRIEDVLDGLKNGRVNHSQAISSLLLRSIDAIAGMLDGIAGGTEAPGSAAGLCAELEQAAAGGDGGRQGEGRDVQDTLSGDRPGPLSVSPARQRGDETIRVSAAKIDGLIRLMGEMMTAEIQSAETLARLREALRLSAKLSAASGSPCAGEPDEVHGILAEVHSSLKEDLLSRENLTRQLLEASLTLRTLPLATVFEGFPRTVRDIALSLGKEVELVVEGSDIELDKMIIEKIGDPLLHMIRNAVDHGIESGEERLRAGKDRKGTIRLSAWFERGSVMILLRDDGRGISPDTIRSRALRRNPADRETLAAMSDAELREFIFLPGFSTSEIVTDLSGRGVGLDVVRKSIIEDLRGSIRIDSHEGAGTTFVLKLPLNLALFRLLFVAAAGRTFAFLADAVEEVLTISRDELITVVDKKAVRLRDEVIPVEELGVLLSLPGRGYGEDERLLIAVVCVGNEKLGLVIDAVIHEESAVVKPLPPHLKNIRIVSGVTVRGRGEIVAVLAVPLLCAAAREKKGERPAADAGNRGETGRRELSVLVVDDSISTREIEKSIIEAHGYQVVVAGDGLEALERARERLFDAVVTDIEMPRLDGFTLTERLRMDDRYRHTPIIIVTSRERDEDRKRGILVGANAYIVKGSFDQTSLLETIDSLVA